MRHPTLVYGPERPPDAIQGRIPRVARLLALAIRFDHLIADGIVRDYADLARLGHVSRARVSQIMRLLNLAPDLQQTILFWPPTHRGRDPVTLVQLLPIAALLNWNDQRRQWHSRFPDTKPSPMKGDDVMTQFRGFIDADGNPVATILLPDGEHQIYGPVAQRVPVTLEELRQQLGRADEGDPVRIDAEVPSALQSRTRRGLPRRGSLVRAGFASAPSEVGERKADDLRDH